MSFNEVFKLINLLFGNFYHLLFFLKFHIEVRFMGKVYLKDYFITKHTRPNIL